MRGTSGEMRIAYIVPQEPTNIHPKFYNHFLKLPRKKNIYRLYIFCLSFILSHLSFLPTLDLSVCFQLPQRWREKQPLLLHFFIVVNPFSLNVYSINSERRNIITVKERRGFPSKSILRMAKFSYRAAAAFYVQNLE